MSTIAITGASGFIGRHLVATLLGMDGLRIKLLSRSRQEERRIKGGRSGVEIVHGDLCKPESVRGFFEPGCIAVNLVYLRDAGEKGNLAAIAHLLDACREANVGRLIHCSTADVVGRAKADIVTEQTACRPITEYAITKLKVEHAVLDASRNGLDVAILRPTAVFGPGGASLTKLADDLTRGSRFRNYLRSCLFGRRRMNLVHIANVVTAIVFLVNRPGRLGGELYIVSDDDSRSNNFADVERVLMKRLEVPYYRMPRMPLPPKVLQLLLHCMRRNNTNPRTYYAPGKLMSAGLERPISFEAGLENYAEWYSSCRLADLRCMTSDASS